MFGAGGYPLVSAEALFYLKNFGFVLVIALIGSTPIPKYLVKKIKVTKYLETAFILALLVIVTAYLVDGSFNPFLYFRF